MKSVFGSILLLAALMPVSLRAATRQMDSSPFTFPGGAPVARPNAASHKLDAVLQIAPGSHRGSVKLRYAVSAEAGAASLCIFALNGLQLAEIALREKSGSVLWEYAKNRVSAGIYLASLRCGKLDTRIRLSIVK
jgi:hypothetical protein